MIMTYFFNLYFKGSTIKKKGPKIGGVGKSIN